MWMSILLLLKWPQALLMVRDCDIGGHVVMGVAVVAGFVSLWRIPDGNQEWEGQGVCVFIFTFIHSILVLML